MIGAETIEGSKETYPECAEEGVYPLYIDTILEFDILSYDFGNFVYQSENATICFKWLVFFENGNTKALVHKTIDGEFARSEITTGIELNYLKFKLIFYC